MSVESALPAARAHHPHHGLAGVDADAPPDWRQALREQLLLQLGCAVDEVICASDSEQRMVVLRTRSIPERDDLVAHIFVDRSVPGEDDPAQVVEVHLHDIGYV